MCIRIQLSQNTVLLQYIPTQSHEASDEKQSIWMSGPFVAVLWF